jgi:NMD protein affecting ribosome stability and mRNA decay
MNRAHVASGKVATGERNSIGRLSEPTACERCGAVFSRRAWRRRPLPVQVRWTVCPACRQAGEERGFGRIVLRGDFVRVHEADIRTRIRNVAARAARTQPERRVSAVEAMDGGLEVLTTSQKLAHRIVHELKKTFRGRATYAWSDDGTLFATWQRDR